LGPGKSIDYIDVKKGKKKVGELIGDIGDI
jgi:hypothetical protein